jgi:hypothetical protein
MLCPSPRALVLPSVYLLRLCTEENSSRVFTAGIQLAIGSMLLEPRVFKIKCCFVCGMPTGKQLLRESDSFEAIQSIN